jgi:hypothetical protein
MMGSNIDMMDTLVRAKQEDLQRAGKPGPAGRETGPIRKSAGALLIRLGEHLAGTKRTPATTPAKLATH